MDPKFPRERVELLVADSGSRIVVTESSCKGVLDGLSTSKAIQTLVLDDAFARPSSMLSEQKSENPARLQQDTSLAYIIYTSGTTGKPKGVCLEHHSIVKFIKELTFTHSITADDHLLSNAGLAFDASIHETWPTFAVGGCLHPCVDDDIRLSPSRMVDFLRTEEITMAFLTTQVCEAVLDEPLAALKELKLTTMWTAGEKLHKGAKAGTPFRLFNLYGPSENTLLATAFEVEAGFAGTPLIGRAVPYTQVYVLDKQGNPVPPGVAGELYVGGTQVSRGYFNNRKKTESSFLPDPFAGAPGARMYKTGDLVKWTGTGFLDFVGRADTQVKIRGHRVELGEIEAILLERDDVKEVCTVAMLEGNSGGKQIVAYVVVAPGAKLSNPNKVWREFMKAKVPAYMVPSCFMLLDRIPLTANGKVDKRALPKPNKRAYAADVVQASTPIEEKLIEIWKVVLGVDEVGIHNSFFDLGGHSLKLARMMSKVAAVLGVSLPLSIVFKTPTIHGLAKLLTVALAKQSLHSASSTAAMAGGDGGAGSGQGGKVAGGGGGGGGAPSSFTQISGSLRGYSSSLIRRGELGTSLISPPGSAAKTVANRLHQRNGGAKESPLASPLSSLRSPSAAFSYKSSHLSNWKKRSRSARTGSTSSGGSSAYGGRAGLGIMSAAAADDRGSLNSLRVLSPLQAHRRRGSSVTERGGRGEGSEASEKLAVPPNAFPMSYNQSSLWIMAKLDKKRVDFVVHYVGKFSMQAALSPTMEDGKSVIAGIQTCFDELVKRHASLRTSYCDIGGNPYQIIHPEEQSDKRFLFEHNILDSNSEQALSDMVQAQIHEPFDLVDGPIFRVHLYETPSGTVCMLLTAHHIAMDGYSLEILVNEFSQLLRGRRGIETGAKELPEVVIDPAQFAASQKSSLQSTEGERMWNFWHRYLGGHVPVLNIPTDRPRPPVQQQAGAWHKFKFPTPLVTRLREFIVTEESNVTLFMVLVTAFNVLLHRYTNQDDIVIGTPMAARLNDALDNMVAHITNPVCIRTPIVRDATFKRVLSSVMQASMDAFMHQEYPFPLIVERLANHRDPSRTPLFQVIFSLNQAFRAQDGDSRISLAAHGEEGAAPADLGGMEFFPMTEDQHTSPYDLQLYVDEISDHELAGSIQYSTALFDVSLVGRVTAALRL